METDAVALTAGGKITPYRLIDLIICKDTAVVDGQQEQDFIFLDGKFYFLLIQKNFPAAWIDCKARER